MNNVLELKGKRFVQASKSSGGGGPAMNSKELVTNTKLQNLANKLYQIYRFWSNENKPFNGILISVYYNKIVAKTNRISGLFKGDQSNYAIVGAKFNTEKTKHIITYFLSLDDLIRSMELLHKGDSVLSNQFKNGINKTAFDDKNTISGLSGLGLSDFIYNKNTLCNSMKCLLYQGIAKALQLKCEGVNFNHSNHKLFEI